VKHDYAEYLRNPKSVTISDKSLSRSSTHDLTFFFFKFSIKISTKRGREGGEEANYWDAFLSVFLRHG
jgi:hypothetical protein